MHDRVCIVIPTLDPRRVTGLIAQCSAHGWSECVVVHPGNAVALDGAVSLGTGAPLGPAAARNYGARTTKKPFLCFIDDDVELGSDAIALLLARCTQDAQVAVGPLLSDGPMDGYWRRCMHRVMAPRQFIEGAMEQPTALMSMVLMVRAEPFWAVGGFDETFAGPAGEDTALTMRLATLGRLSVQRDVIVQHHPHPDGWWAATRRLYRYGAAWASVGSTTNRHSTYIRRLPGFVRACMLFGVPLIAGFDAVIASSPGYWPGYLWLRMCWYVGWLTAPATNRAPIC